MITIPDILPVLSVYPYALLYYAVLLASAGLALFAFQRAKPENNPALRGSLLVIFFSQFLLLTLSMMIHQGLPQLSQIFPIVFRALTLVSIIWLLRALFWRGQERRAWLIWVFTVVILTAGSLSLLAWMPLAAEQSFNGSLQDQLWVGITLLTIALGAIVYLIQNRSDRLEGMFILILATMGYLFYLAMPNAGSLPASVMISQLLYYPLLISLAWQRKKPDLIPEPPLPSTERRELSGEVAARLLDVSLQQTNSQIQRSLTHSLGLYLLADLCGFLVSDPQSKSLMLQNTYDLIREDFLGNIELSITTFPNLGAHFEDRAALVSNTVEEFGKEKAALMESIGYNRLGNLLFYPLNPIDAPTARGLLCLSPYTERSWNPRELDQLRVIAPKVSQILDEAADIEERATSAQRLQILLNQVRRDRAETYEQFQQSQNLLKQVEQELHLNNQNHDSEVEVWLTRQEALEEQLEELQNTLRQNEATIAQAEALRLEKEELELSMAQNTLQVEGLRKALEQARDVLEQMEPKTSSPHSSKSKVKLSDGLQVLLETLTLDFEQKQMHIEFENSLKAEPAPEKIEQLLRLSRYLLQNALTVSKDGAEVLLEVMPSQDHPGFVELRVSDAGPGLKPEEQTSFLANFHTDADPAETNWGDLKALQEAVDLTQSLGGHWWIHSVPDTLTIHRLAIPVNSGAEETGSNLATSSPEKH